MSDEQNVVPASMEEIIEAMKDRRGGGQLSDEVLAGIRLLKVRELPDDKVPFEQRYPWWTCECRTEARHVRQLIDVDDDKRDDWEPYCCPTCGRVWDGRDWFISAEWYNVISNWENIQSEAWSMMCGERALIDPEMHDWVVEMMDFVDANTHFDATLFWNLYRAVIEPQQPFSKKSKDALKEELEAVFPIIEVFWRRGGSRPHEKDEWENDDDSPPPVTLRQRPAEQIERGAFVATQRTRILRGEREKASISELFAEYRAISNTCEKGGSHD